MSLTGWLSFLAVLLSISAGLAGLAWAAGHVFHALRQAVRGWRIDREMKAMPHESQTALNLAALSAIRQAASTPKPRHDAHAAFAVHNETIARLGLTGLAHAPRKGQ
jgi:hypothetical protein